mmetsp:Transcript_10282/g.30737  ORF Transcript_10282/g.30737 Transcript_10282/m.30737 type:complete len:361 (-) Transcript_10282:358-1440(-)
MRLAAARRRFALPLLGLSLQLLQRRGLSLMANSAPMSPTSSPQRVAVVGAGAIGLYYGGRLLEAGHDVRFLMRRDLAACREKGLRIVSEGAGDAYFGPETMARAAVSRETGFGFDAPVDWIFVALKTYSLESLFDLCAPLLDEDGKLPPNAKILATMNGMGLEDKIAAVGSAHGLRPENLYGGMAFICANRGPQGSGEVQHLKYGTLAVGSYVDDATRLAEASELFAGSKVPVTLAENLRRTRYSKLCWNLPFNGIATALGGTDVTLVVQNPKLRALVTKVMHEVVDLCEEDLKQSGQEGLNREEIVKQMFELTDNMGSYLSSTVLDLRAKARLELEYMFMKPLARAHELGVPVTPTPEP